jgi:hypothetical protein
MADEGIGMLITRGRVAPAAAVLVALLLAGSAQAAAPYEPNDTPESAHGPIGTPGGPHVIEAAGETTLDEDWFSFFVPEGPHDVAVTLDRLAPEASICASLSVECDDGLSELASGRADALDPLGGRLSDTVTGPALAYVSVDGCGGFAAVPAPYRLTLEGDWPAQDPRDSADAGDPAGADRPSERAAARCHAAAAHLRAANLRVRAARRADRRHRTRAHEHRLAAARRARARAIAKVVRLC